MSSLTIRGMMTKVVLPIAGPTTRMAILSSGWDARAMNGRMHPPIAMVRQGNSARAVRLDAPFLVRCWEYQPPTRTMTMPASQGSTLKSPPMVWLKPRPSTR